MGDVISFDLGRARSPNTARGNGTARPPVSDTAAGSSADIVILPVVRIERHAPEPVDHAPHPAVLGRDRA